MPKLTKPSDPSLSSRKPPRRPAVFSGAEPGWDLREVDSSYLVAELIRRGECPKLQPAKAAKPVSLFG